MGGGGNCYLDSSESQSQNSRSKSKQSILISSLRGFEKAKASVRSTDPHLQIHSTCHSEGGDSLPKNPNNQNVKDLDSSLRALHFAQNDGKFHFTPKHFFILGIIFNLSLLGFFKYTDFLLENFNAFSQIARLDFNIPLPHILLPLALSFVTFQQIAFLFDCYKHATGQSNENLHIDFIDYALFISFFPQLIAGPIVHHREMMPQFAKMGNSSCHTKHSLRHIGQNKVSKSPNCHIERSEISQTNPQRDFSPTAQNDKKWHFAHDDKMQSFTQNDKNSAKSQINYELLAKGIFIFSIGLFKKVFIADSFAKWANAGFSVVEKGGYLNIAESWATSLSYTFQLYFDFSGYCDMAIGLGLMFGIVLPLNFNSPYKSLNIAEFWRRWHITLGRFLKECLYIPLGGNRGKPIFRKKSGRILDEKSGLCSCEQGNRTDSQWLLRSARKSYGLTKRTTNLPDLSPKANATTLRNLFIVAFLSGIWHGAGWGFVIWGILHGVAMVIYRIYAWILERLAKSVTLCHIDKPYNKLFSCHTKHSLCHTEHSEVSNTPNCHIERSKISIQNTDYREQNTEFMDFSPTAQNDKKWHFAHNDSTYTMRFLAFTQSKIYKILVWLITFNFINIAWIFFRAENLSGAVNLLKGMFGIVWVDLPQKWHRMPETLAQINGRNDTIFYIIIAIIVCLACRNSFEMLKLFDTKILCFKLALRIFNTRLYLKGGALFVRFVLTLALFYASVWAMIANVLDSNAYTPFLYFNF